MKIENDYIVRLIDEIGRVLTALIKGKDAAAEYELPDEKGVYTALDSLYERIIQLADSGDINEAENLLLEAGDLTDNAYFDIALSFYMHLNRYTDAFLQEHDYSREEIREGLESLSEKYGIGGLL